MRFFLSVSPCFPALSLWLGALALTGCDPVITDTRDAPGQEEEQGIAPGSGPNSEESDSQGQDPDPNPNPDLQDGDQDSSGNDVESDDESSVDDGCQSTSIAPEILPPNVMLIVDKSGSMYHQRWIDNGVDKTRWETLHETVNYLVDNLQNRVNFGLKLFPSLLDVGEVQGSDTCLVEDLVDVGCATSNASAIMSKMPAADAMVSGSTPITAGIAAAYEHLKTLDDKNPEAMVLVVDGGMSCGERPQSLNELVQEAAENKIHTYVVGIDLDPQTFGSLSNVAQSAGTDRVYNSGSKQELVSALESVVGQLVSCRLPLGSAPVYMDHVRVRVDGSDAHPWIDGAQSCAQAKAQGHTRGWVFLDSEPANTQIELCESSCEEYQQNPKVDVVFECPPPE